MFSKMKISEKYNISKINTVVRVQSSDLTGKIMIATAAVVIELVDVTVHRITEGVKSWL